jgi:FAD:protein FMN transferase
MKKLIAVLVLVALTLSLIACRDDNPEDPETTTHTLNLFDFMDTFISVAFVLPEGEDSQPVKDAITDIYRTYHALTTSYEPLPEDSGFKANIFEINSRVGETVEIDKPLYDILLEAEAMKEVTDGYFDVSVGKVVDIWKESILGEDGYLFETIPEDVFQSTLTRALAIEIAEQPFELEEDQGTYHVTVTDESVKIDLGAISKGYATEVVKNDLVSRGITYFSISAGSSSIAIGQNINRPDEDHVFVVSLANPVRTGLSDGTYGTIRVKDTGVTTSGNYEQYALYEGQRYHHIVSPLTNRPEQHYHTVTLIGGNIGHLDALSTALFSMDPDTFGAWMDLHGEDFGIEVIRFNTDGTVWTSLQSTPFEDIR